MSVHDEAMAEAERRWPEPDWDDPNEEYVAFVATSRAGFIAGAEWQWETDEQREMTREITDREINAAADVLEALDGGDFYTIARAALKAAKEARR